MGRAYKVLLKVKVKVLVAQLYSTLYGAAKRHNGATDTFTSENIPLIVNYQAWKVSEFLENCPKSISLYP